MKFVIFRQKIPSAAALHLHSFQFDDFSLEDGDTLKVLKKTYFKLSMLYKTVFICKNTISSMKL
jgi:hypothetical protein